MEKNNSDFTSSYTVLADEKNASPDRTDQNSATIIVVIFAAAMLVMSAVIIAVSNNVISGEIRSRRTEGLYPESDLMLFEADPAAQTAAVTAAAQAVPAKAEMARIADNFNINAGADAANADASAVDEESTAETESVTVTEAAAS